MAPFWKRRGADASASERSSGGSDPADPAESGASGSGADDAAADENGLVDELSQDEQELLAVLSAELRQAFDGWTHPNELFKHPQFTTFHGLIARFTAASLIRLAEGPDEVTADTALAVLGSRPQSAQVYARILDLLGRFSPWRGHFFLPVIHVHRGPADPIIADTLIAVGRNSQPPVVMVLQDELASFLLTYLKKGEPATYGPKLDSLMRPELEKQRGLLDWLGMEEMQPLRAELERRIEVVPDLDFLRTLGKVFEPVPRPTGAPSRDETPGSAPVPTTGDEPPGGPRLTDRLLDCLKADPPRSMAVVGPPGVGKTRVVESFLERARRRGWTVLVASSSELVAGQRFQGDLEERVGRMFREIHRSRRVIWYVPDMPQLAWAGRHEFERRSVLDTALPAAETGQIIFIGEARSSDYEHLVQKHPRCRSVLEVLNLKPVDEPFALTLARRWAEDEVAGLPEPAGDPDETTAILTATDLLPDPVLHEAWQLASHFLREQVVPGNLLDFLKVTRRRIVTQQGPRVGLTLEDLITTLAHQTNLPPFMIDDRQRLDRAKLRAFFEQRIHGQAEAVDCLVERITMIKAGLTDPDRPQGVFLFAGPSGTGKTELARTLAEYLFGSRERLIRLDMSEFQTFGGLDALLGGDGDDRAGVSRGLLDRVREQPFSVVLLDEFEKAAPAVWDIFLQVFDAGRLTDRKGRTVDFRHTIILLTSNLGTRLSGGERLGFTREAEGFHPAAVLRTVEQAFRPELRNRLDRTVVFRPLGRETMRRILTRELKLLHQRRGIRHHAWEIVWDDTAIDFLLERGFTAELGARPLKRAIDRYLLAPLADSIVDHQFPAGEQFLLVQREDQRLVVRFVDPDAPAVMARGAGGAAVETVTTEGGIGAPTAEEMALPEAGFLERILLDPHGSSVQIAIMEAAHASLDDRIGGPEWQERKQAALEVMSEPGFWESDKRFAIMGEIEYRDRIETIMESAGSLLFRLRRASGSAADGDLVKNLARQLYLARVGDASLETGVPWEVYLAVEGGDTSGIAAAEEWRLADRIGAMYRLWAEKRRMRCKVLGEAVVAPETGGGGSAPYELVLAISGIGAGTLLGGEAGLHVWEVPDESARDRRYHRTRVRVRVAPQPDTVAAGRESPDLAEVRRILLATPSGAAGSTEIVRRYRQDPSPLVRDNRRGWRTGRIDLVLGGDFDLFTGTAAAADGT